VQSLKEPREKTSISKVVRDILLSHPSILDCIKLDIVNYTALARKLEPMVSKAMGRKVNVDAIKMALIRFSDEVKNTRDVLEERVRRVLAGSVITFQTDLTVITLKREVVVRVLSDLIKMVKSTRFFQLTQGLQTYTIIVASELEKKVLDLLGMENVEDILRDHSAIILISPLEIVRTPGIISYITSMLAFRGINITQIISCHKDTILVIDRRDALKAYQILEEIILNMRHHRGES